MAHLTVPPWAMAAVALIISLMMWAPAFAFAYWRRKFGGTKGGYIGAWAITSLVTVLLFGTMSIMEFLRH